MRVPVSWLRDFAPFGDDVEVLVANLDDLGLVVEGVEHVGAGLDAVVVARVLEIAAIAGADRIRRVVVDDGAGPVEVVCGAWNFQVGDLVPLAPVGAVLPGGFEISRRRMKGVDSFGMLCSAKELGLSEDHAGILVVGDNGPVGSDEPRPGMALTEALGIEADVVLDVAVEANRPDAWCMAGIARDLAARLKLPFALPEPPGETGDAGGAGGTRAARAEELTSVELVDPDLCPRFTARVVTELQVAPAPGWVARRLMLAGMRPVNSVVDASNYVMLELGQPTHPYDLDRLAGAGLRVRAARRGEEVVTLDAVRRVLGMRSVGPGDDLRDCVICDAEDMPVGIAGVMGGKSSEITGSTTRVLLEAAYFAPMAIARTSKRLALRTEASARFERGVDPEGIDRAALRFIELLGAVDGTAPVQAAGAIDSRGELPSPIRVILRVGRVGSLLGSPLSKAEIRSCLEPIGFHCEDAGEDALGVEVPSFRPDTSREVDVVEEVARHVGYSNLGKRRPSSPQVGRLSPYQRERRVTRDVMAGMGAYEVWTSSLLAPRDHEHAGIGGASIEVGNPLSPEESILRRSLLPGMMKALGYNVERRQGDLRLFEVGRVFPFPERARVQRAIARGSESVVDEREMLGMVLAMPYDDARSAAAAWGALAGTLGITGVSLLASDTAGRPAGLHPSRSAFIIRQDGTKRASVVAGDLAGSSGVVGDVAGSSGVVGVVGEVDPDVLEAFGISGGSRRVGWLEVDLERLLACERRSPLAKPVSRFPSSDVDLAFDVPDAVSAAEVHSVISRAAGPLLEACWLFDVYRDAARHRGSRSLAYRLRFSAADRTLTDSEVGAIRQRCVDAAERELGLRLRG